MDTPVITTSITKVSGDEGRRVNDYLAVEEPLEIRITYGQKEKREQKNISVTMRTPGADAELAVGFLFSEGIIASIGDVRVADLSSTVRNVINIELAFDTEVDLHSVQRNFYTTSSCGVCGKASIDAVMTRKHLAIGASLMLSSDVFLKCQQDIIRMQKVFGDTGGLHASALVGRDGTIETIREDVGRHNALDKLIGALLLEDRLPLKDQFIFLSGRAGFELVQKAAMAGVEVLAAVGAPSSLAVEFAEQFGMTLLGFVRNDRFNIYSGPERIRIQNGR